MSFLNPIGTTADQKLMADYLSNHFRFQFDSPRYPAEVKMLELAGQSFHQTD